MVLLAFIAWIGWHILQIRAEKSSTMTRLGCCARVAIWRSAVEAERPVERFCSGAASRVPVVYWACRAPCSVRRDRRPTVLPAVETQHPARFKPPESTAGNRRRACPLSGRIGAVHAC